MKSLFWIAMELVKELFHEKLFWIVFLFSLISVLFFSVLGNLTYTAHQKITFDFMLGMSDLILLLMGIGLPPMVLQREFLLGSVFLTLSRPLSRWTWIAGKFFGIMIVLFIVNFSFIALLTGWVYLDSTMRLQWTPWIQHGILTFIRSTLIAAVSLFFATRFSGLLSIALSLSTYIVSYLTFHNEKLAPKTADLRFIHICTSWIPKFYLFDKKTEAAYGTSISFFEMRTLIFYGSVCVLLYLLASIYMFEKREIS